MLHLDIGLSALRANQQALNTLSNNVANANTPGYHRQQIRLEDRLPISLNGLNIGTGVSISRISRARSDLIERVRGQQVSLQAENAARTETLDQLEGLLTPSETSLHARTQDFFNQWELLSARPSDLVQRREVIESAASLAEEVNFLSSALDGIEQSLDERTSLAVEQINGLVARIVELNDLIKRNRALGDEPNDLLDRRDQLIDELSAEIDVTRQERGGQLVSLSLAHGRINFFSSEFELTAVPETADGLTIRLGDREIPAEQLGGRLGGLLESRQVLVADVKEQLAEFAETLVSAVDQLHATGIGLDGAFQQVTGLRGVDDVNIPLADTDLPFPVSQGTLTLAVTDESTGQRRLYQVSIDPQVDTLNDVAAKIGAVPNLDAFVNSEQGTLRIVSQPGFAFDFTGQQETAPDVSGITGTTSPLVQGNYSGSDNDVWSFTALAAGTIGVTDGLQIEVRDQGGALITRLDVGADYEPGSPLEVLDGVAVTFSSGTINTSDTFATAVVANPDTGGLLSALGMHSMFEGHAPGDIRVRQELLGDPSRLSAAITPFHTDGGLVARFGELRDSLLLSGGSLTLEEFVNDMTVRVADQTQEANSQAEALADSLRNLDAQWQAVSGVDPNEELILMLQFQRSFQAAARFLAGFEEALDELFLIV